MLLPKLNVKNFFEQYSEQPSSLLYVYLIIIVSSVVYCNSLFNGFVFDDNTNVLNNPWLKSPEFIPNIFSSNAEGFDGRVTNYYRPLTHIIYMITASVFGLNPWGFHFINVLFHTGTSILVFLIGSRVLKDHSFPKSPFFIFPPFVAAVLFAVHPIHTEAVAWVAGITDLSSAFFLLSSLYLYIRTSDNASSLLNLSYLLSVVFFFLATLCKEPALTLPLFLVAYDFTLKKDNMTLASYFKRYSLYLISICAYLIMRLHALKSFAPLKEHLEMSQIINIFPLFTKYLQKLLLPFNLSVAYDIKPINSIFDLRAIISIFITIAFLFLFLYSFRKSKKTFFSICCLIIPLLPCFYIPALGKSGVFAERYLYLPSFGFVMLLALLIPNGLKKNVSTKVITSVFLLLIVVYSVGTVYRNSIWRNDYTLWMDTVRKAPDAAFPHYNLGNQLRSQGRIDEAIEQYQISLRLEPTKAEAHNNLGVAYSIKGELGKAIAEFQLALQNNPFSPNAYNNLGITYANMGYLDKAIENYKMAIALKPDDLTFQKHLLEAYEKKKASGANFRK